jgi:hypothetical protein
LTSGLTGKRLKGHFESRILRAVPKWCKFIVGILLLPVCAGAVSALGEVIKASGQADTTWVALGSGAACWLVIYLLLPKPMWIYVLGHEFTHALWTWLFGGKVKKLKASARGGHVIVTKNNFLIALAPYFFPLYAVLVVAVFLTGHLIWNWQAHCVWFHLLLGAAYAFHLTLTWHILKSSQSDISDQGYLFSGVIIFLGNITLLIAAIPMVAGQISVLTALGWWVQATGQIVARIGKLL